MQLLYSLLLALLLLLYTHKMSTNLILKKSACLILLRDCLNIQNNNFFDYKILFLSRSSNVSWANMMVFPGGNQDLQDIDYFKTNIDKFVGYYDIKSEYSRQCLIRKLVALRETYEETGLYFLKNELSTTKEFDLLKKVLDYHRKDSSSPSFNELSSHFEFDIPQCYPFLRTISMPIYNKRYDIQFFLLKANTTNLINIPKGLQNITNVNSLNKLKINEEESSSYKWLNPLECLKLFYNKEISLGPPQVMILNILCSFKKHFEVIAYINKFSEKTKFEDIARDPLTFPNLFLFTDYQNQKLKSDGSKYCFSLPGDINYPLKSIIDREGEKDYLKEIKDRYQGLLSQKQNNAKIYFPNMEKLFEGEFEPEINVDFDTPLQYIKNPKHLQELL